MNRKQWFLDILKKYDRIAICGVVNGGKTTLSRMVKDRPRFHTDDLRFDAWSDVSKKTVEQTDNLDRFVVEGMRVPHALRKDMKVDCVVWLNQELEDNSKGQKSMSKASRTVLDEWREAHPGVPYFVAPDVAKDSEDEAEANT